MGYIGAHRDVSRAHSPVAPHRDTYRSEHREARVNLLLLSSGRCICFFSASEDHTCGYGLFGSEDQIWGNWVSGSDSLKADANVPLGL